MSDIGGLKHLFLAHSSDDKGLVRRLATDISLRGVPVWFDEWEIKVGDSLIDRISAGILEAGWLGVVLSTASVQSAWVRRELNAGLMRELELKSVFVLPIRIDNAEIPLLLKEKRYADFRLNYDLGLEELLRTTIANTASSAMLRSVPELQLHLLPAVSEGRAVTAYDLNRVILAINTLERQLGLVLTDMHLFQKGQAMGFQSINRLLGPIETLRTHVGLKVNWRRHPTRSGDLYSAQHMNELYASLNDVIEAALRRGARDA
jgi:hypothetical protein